MKLPTNPGNFVKIIKVISLCWAFVFRISVKYLVWDSTHHPFTDGGEIWCGEVDRQISPHGCNVSPLRGVKPQNRPPPSSNRNTGTMHCAQCCR